MSQRWADLIGEVQRIKVEEKQKIQLVKNMHLAHFTQVTCAFDFMQRVFNIFMASFRATYDVQQLRKFFAKGQDDFTSDFVNEFLQKKHLAEKNLSQFAHHSLDTPPNANLASFNAINLKELINLINW